MTKIIAHRGASKVAPENTMPAFIKAKGLGAYGVELDVYTLPDNTVVVHHDSNLENYKDAGGSIYSYTHDTIKSLAVGEKFSNEYKNETIPYFDEVLVYVKQSNLFLNCEIKRDTGYRFGDEDEIIKLIDRYDMAENTIISSFDHLILSNIKTKYPNYRLGMLYYHNNYGIDIIDYCLKNSFDAIHPEFELVDKALIDKAHKNGIEVNVWTVDNAEDIIRMQELGVDSIITNDVETALKCLKV